MDTLYLEEARLTHLVTHRVGNAHNEEGVGLSSKGSRIKQEALPPLMSYMLSAFKPEEFFNLGHAEGLSHNPLYAPIKGLMEGEEEIVAVSKTIAQRLYAVSNHPKIKGGLLHIARFENIILNGEELEAIGIFKTETTSEFLQIEPGEERYDILQAEGVQIKGLDKGALIFNVDAEQGYRVLVHNAQRATDARYWNDEFLQLLACTDAYHLTKEIMNITKEFVTKQLDQEFEVPRTDQIDLLNRSAAYFKEHDAFDKQEFAQEVLQQPEVIESFGSFEDQYRASYSLEPVQTFEISDTAVKKQGRIFKSVLKLDKNFHVYIHGDKDLIERGEEHDGRKFYKIYFDQES